MISGMKSYMVELIPGSKFVLISVDVSKSNRWGYANKILVLVLVYKHCTLIKTDEPLASFVYSQYMSILIILRGNGHPSTRIPQLFQSLSGDVAGQPWFYPKNSLLQLRGLEGNHSPYQPAFQLVFHIQITLGSRSAYLDALLSFSTRTPSCSCTWNSSSKGLSSQWLKNWTPSLSHVDLTFPPAQPLFSHHQHDVSPCFTIIWLFHHYETIN